MLFNSWVYWIFLPVVLAVYYLLSHRSQNVWLLLASYVFYAWWDWRFLGLILLSTLVDYCAGLALGQQRSGSRAGWRSSVKGRRVVLFVSVATNLGILGFFKYFGFFVDSFIEAVHGIAGYQMSPLALHIILPVGVSFYTFQTMSYTIDVYRGTLPATRNFVSFAAFVAFFPQLVAGPIVRAADLLPQLERERQFSVARFREGAYLILWGLFKKAVVADNLALLVDDTFSQQSGFLVGSAALWAIYAFAIQIYSDFSGYTDIARGSAMLMGFDFQLNFNLPYRAKDPSDFWRRWHISLSSWLRDYLYISLGGNRISPSRTYVNLLTTMVLGGLWHGAAWTFVAWGGYQGLLLAIHRAASRLIDARRRLGRFFSSRYVKACQWFLFMQLVCLGWLFFRAQSFGQVLQVLRAIFTSFNFHAGMSRLIALVVVASPVVCMQIMQVRTGDLNWILRLPPAARGLSYAALLLGLILLGRFAGNEFIYFQF